MGLIDSFESYVEDKYYDDIFNSLKTYINHNRDSLDLVSYSIPDPKSTLLEDFKVVSTLFSDAPGYELKFDIVVTAEIEISGRGKYDWETDGVEQWFLLTCNGILKDGLHDFHILKVEQYSKKRFDSEERLSQYLVPYIYARNLDEAANNFLERYYPQALVRPLQLPIDEIVKSVGLNMEKVHITKTCNIFGQIYFSDANIMVYDKETEEYVPMVVKEGTILVDPDVFFMRNIGSLNNTIIHECVHWDKHQKYFELQKLFKRDVSSISCHVIEGTSSENKRTALQWMEWQANALAPRILMPSKTAKAKIEELLVKLHVEFGRMSESDIMEMVIMELSDFFGVSLFAAKIRAIDLGYDQAIGVFNFIDNKYLPSYSFKAGVLKKNQTFVIGIQDAIYEYASNNEFRESIEVGNLIYIDGLFCLNDLKYIEEQVDGTAKLTDYARNHVDECCLIFEKSYRLNKRFGAKYYRECYLCRDIIADSFTETKYVDTTDNQDKKQKAIELKTLRGETAKIKVIQREAPSSFGGALKYHMKRVGCTVEGLAAVSLIGPKTIQNMRNQDEYPFSLPVVAALCIGMHLHPEFSEDLIEKAGIKFVRSNENHIVYKYLIEHYYKASIHECNEILDEYEMPRMGTEQ